MNTVSVERWYVSAMQHAEHARDREVRDRVGAEARRGMRSRRHTRPAATGITARSIARVAQAVRDRRHGHRDDVVVADAVAELAQHDRDLDRLAVLVARVEVERVRERAEPEDAVARLDVVQAVRRPSTLAHFDSTQLPCVLNGPWYERSRAGEVRVEALGRCVISTSSSSTCEVVLAVGVDGEHQVVGVRARRAASRSRSVGQRGEVRLRHALVHVVHEQAAARRGRGQPRSISARVPSVEPSSTTTSSSTSG